ncbi:sugar kinase [Phenylobacterium sp.]|jgi:Mrp family chromosome partitioning ATPase|uniref:sugar kinase n=1 Tax=Phenylobacterium sp. TaxID=1871053 RepID=UPI002E376A3F|nr:sugar kinase [Phenylobacterium sp.]HEX2561563.1 sugar kinase [Phenylobacterium sp.]
MVDLSAEMAELWASLGAPAAGAGRLVQFIAARRAEGTSTVAREFAHFAARRAGRSVWLVDLDLLRSAQHAAIAADTERYGPLSAPAGASPDGSAFFTVRPPAPDAEGRPVPDAAWLSAHQVGAGRLWVTRFQRQALQGGRSVHVLPTPDYWRALRAHVDLVIVDSPAADRSQAGLTVAPHMDQTVLVVAADQADVAAPARLKDALHGAGGHVAGLFFNRGQVEAPAFLKALLP